MTPLTDIAIGHVKRAGKSGPSKFFVMHPFEVTRGTNVGKYELLRNTAKSGEKQKNRSVHVTKLELSELYARGWMEGCGINLRLRPTDNNYPTDPPVKKVAKSCILAGTDFDRMVRMFDDTQPLNPNVLVALQRIGIGSS